MRAADRLRWDEADLDLAGDADAWPKLPKYLRVPLARLLSGFCVAENAVAEHLEPFEAGTDDPELRACFAAQADDERRHARFFNRVVSEVLGVDPEDEARELAGAGVVELFEHTLPAKAQDLVDGRCDLSQAVTLYHLVLEGVVFSVGQAAALELLDEAATLPGTREGVNNVQADERWHVGLGVRCLQDTGVREKELEETLNSAARATSAWQTDRIGPSQVAHAVEQHRRRLAQAGRTAEAAA
ncbi:MAG TPA: ribonucleotide-diphosphate reductase subunit beta [Thermoleophilaceae bacterium]|nr:ribonucleotide-diphosphate reductase subunit beta [Thermoleophilaceae bacterium]